MSGISLTGIISAVPFESRELLKAMGSKRKFQGGLTRGTIGRARVVHIDSGVGIANAAVAATVLMERFKPDTLLVFGIGGAYPRSGLVPGDLALAETEIYADSGLSTGEGFEAMHLVLLRRGRKKFYNEFPLDARLLRAARRALGEIAAGTFLTVSAASATAGRARRLGDRHGAICENMEGAAVAHTGARYGTPVLELRGISNMVGDRDLGNWEKKKASARCAEALVEYLRGS